MNYFKKHWKGELSLPVSYWINIVLVNLLFFYITEYIAIRIKHPIFIIKFIIISNIIFHFTIYLWQIIGTWRCSKKYINNGKKFWARIVRVIIIISTLFIVPRYLRLNKLQEANFEEISKLDYKIDIVEKESKIHLIGGMKFGLSKEIQKLLDNNEKITGIIIDSHGGLIYEGYKLAEIIEKYNLNTYSIIECSSAATIAFIAGKERYISNETKMGFHNPFSILEIRKDIHLNAIETNTARKQNKFSKSDYLKYLQKHGVTNNFIDKLENLSSKDLFYPTINELIESNIINGIQKSNIILNQGEQEKPNLSSLINNWMNVYIPDICTFEIAQTLEIQGGFYKEFSNNFLEKNYEITSNPERVVMQPKGINEFNASSLSNYCRFIIETEISDEPLLELTDPIYLSEDELIIYEEIIRESIEEGMKLMQSSGIEMKIIDWNGIRVSHLNNVDALEIGYTRQLKQNPYVFVRMFKVFNKNRIHTITVSYRISEKKLWDEDLNKMLNSINFIETKNN